MKRTLASLLVFVFGLGVAAGWVACQTRGQYATANPDSLAPGTPITIIRPTGERVTTIEGKLPSAKRERVELTSYRVLPSDGPPREVPRQGGDGWVITVGIHPRQTVIYAEPATPIPK